MEGLRLLPRKKAAFATICLTGIYGGLPAAQADMTLNFEAFTPGAGEVVNTIAIDCRFSNPTRTGESCARGSNNEGDPDKTPFYEETITLANGDQYYHVILGDPDSDFVQEYYIRAGWDYWLGYNQFPHTASEGGLNGGLDATPGGPEGEYSMSNFVSPLDPNHLVSGNGTGNPNRVIFRQIVKGVGFEQEVLKDKLRWKPLITQTVIDAEMVSNFSVDMRDIHYSDDTTAGTMINTMTITDSQTGLLFTDFDIHNRPGNTDITAGRYTISGGIRYKGSLPEYNYAGSANFDIYSVDWSAYWNADENVPDCDPTALKTPVCLEPL